MRFDSLASWLDWQQTLNPQSIDLGLERVQKVYQRMGLERLAGRVISVAGTNGKGSTVAAYEQWLHHNGYRVASYTSPHLLHYNERISIDLQVVEDQALCEAFQRVDDARGEIALTYFEFGTLAAFSLIEQAQPDVAILEVGLGGRLDAVNIIDAELAHLTPIGLDHQQWLGETREQIGAEKAGILRTGAMAICNDRDPPQSVINAMQKLQCQIATLGVDYDFKRLDSQHFKWINERYQLMIEQPLAGEHQAHNLSGVLAGLSLMGYLDNVDSAAISDGFANLQCPGRLQRIQSKLPAKVYVDVGHNEDAARVLSSYFTRHKPEQGRMVVLLGMLEDKDAGAFVSQLRGVVDEWWLLGLAVDRGLSVDQLADRLSGLIEPARRFDQIESAMADAVLSLNNQDILLVTGSFMTVEAVLRSSVINSGASWNNN